MNKATVFQIGNRLSRTMPRKDAFIQAWQIIKSGSVMFLVRGVMAGSRQEALRRLANYEPAQVHAFLMQEPENPVDKNAIAVMVGVQGGKNYYKLGYIPASETAKAAAVRGRVSIRVLPGDINGARLTLACNMYGIIYKAKGPSGLVYIGQTTQTLARRKSEHKVRALKQDRRYPFGIALLDEGFSNFQWDQIDTAENAEELDAKEKQWIAHYQSDNPGHGYNGTTGGISYTVTQETRQKMSEAGKGKKHSEKHRRKIGEAQRGKQRTPEQCKRISEAQKGKQLSAEHRRKISEGLKGKHLSPATRRKISATLKSKGILPPWIKNK